MSAGGGRCEHAAVTHAVPLSPVWERRDMLGVDLRHRHPRRLWKLWEIKDKKTRRISSWCCGLFLFLSLSLSLYSLYTGPPCNVPIWPLSALVTALHLNISPVPRYFNQVKFLDPTNHAVYFLGPAQSQLIICLSSFTVASCLVHRNPQVLAVSVKNTFSFHLRCAW